MNIAPFSLPDDLGWECNDELQGVINDWLETASKYKGELKDPMMMAVLKAELIDNMYSVIKKWQQKEPS